MFDLIGSVWICICPARHCVDGILALLIVVMPYLDSVLMVCKPIPSFTVLCPTSYPA